MKLTWIDNVAKVGGVKFEIIEWVDMTQGTLFDLDVYIGSGRMTPVTQTTEAMAHAVAEEIAQAIFGGIPVVRKKVRSFGDPEFFRESGVEQPEYWQRGVWVPLEGE